MPFKGCAVDGRQINHYDFKISLVAIFKNNLCTPQEIITLGIILLRITWAVDSKRGNSLFLYVSFFHVLILDIPT